MVKESCEIGRPIYILAVSGGVDSVVMLDLIATNYDVYRDRYCNGAVFPDDFVLAHFDHGIRGEASRNDARFVENLAEKYNVCYRIGVGNLGVGASEESARQARYKFLKNVAAEQEKQGRSIKIMTAHHRDDLLETAVMFILRGTGWRGLAALRSTELIVRPLLDLTKSEIVYYAIENNLDWVQDETNFASKYFRNRIRNWLDSWTVDQKNELLSLIKFQQQLLPKIDDGVNRYLENKTNQTNLGVEINRYHLIMLSDDVALEIVRYLTDSQLTKPQMIRLIYFIKAAKPGKKFIWKTGAVTVSKASACFSVKPSVI